MDWQITALCQRTISYRAFGLLDQSHAASQAWGMMELSSSWMATPSAISESQ